MSEQYFKGATLYCNSCKRYAKKSDLRGSGLITLILILCYIVPGVIYMVWRRAGPKLCTTCKHASLIPVSQPIAQKPITTDSGQAVRIEVDCPACAERILAKAIKCKHCGTDVTPNTAAPTTRRDVIPELVVSAKDEAGKNPSAWLNDILNPKR